MNVDYSYSQQLNLMQKPIVLIIEGPDRCGKSTLARFIASELKAVYLHSTARGVLKMAQRDYMHNMISNVEETVSLSGLPIVLDRSWPSEECYAPVTRPTGQILTCEGIVSPNTVRPPNHEYYSRLKRLNAKYVFCLSHKAIERHEADKNPDHAYTVQQYIAIYNNYVRLFKNMLDEDKFLYILEESGNDLTAFTKRLITQIQDAKKKA